MPTQHLVPKDVAGLYEVHEWRNAAGVLSTSCPQEWADVLMILREFRLYKAEILKGGGNKGPIAKRLDGGLFVRGWRETGFRTAIKVDELERAAPTHKVDCFKGRVALEVEWNSKDSVYDRDLNNFRLLFDLRVIDAGIIITRCSELEKLLISVGRNKSSYGKSTTHMEKLLPKLEGGGAGGCPILVFGISDRLYSEDEAPLLPDSPDKVGGDDD
jgi:Restriction endonuclease BglII